MTKNDIITMIIRFMMSSILTEELAIVVVVVCYNFAVIWLFFFYYVFRDALQTASMFASVRAYNNIEVTKRPILLNAERGFEYSCDILLIFCD